MNSSNQTPQAIRDKGLDYLKKGKEIFNDAKDPMNKERGYDIYKRGLTMMVDYAKSTISPQ